MNCNNHLKLKNDLADLKLTDTFLAICTLQFDPNENAFPAAARMVSAMILQIQNGVIIEGRPGHAPSGVNPGRLRAWERAFNAEKLALTDLQDAIGVERSMIFRAVIQKELETSLLLLPDHIEGMVQ